MTRICRNETPKRETVFWRRCPIPTICCWGEIYAQPFVGCVLRIEGESISGEISVRAIKEFYDGIVQYVKEHKFAFVRVSSNLFYDTNYEIGIRQAGFIRLMSLMLCPFTVVLESDQNRPPQRAGIINMHRPNVRISDSNRSSIYRKKTCACLSKCMQKWRLQKGSRTFRTNAH